MPQAIPTNVITGFLGVGKTTSILHLLRSKPEDEVWSVLVNEFGEIGIDGGLLKAGDAHVREVPGGCICCVGNLPMKVALNMLIGTTNPDRIIIEPTGLGHPAEIVSTLTGEYYGDVLDLRATVTLVDPRKLSDDRYRNNSTFMDQIAIADVLIANKSDLASPADWSLFDQLLADCNPRKVGHQRVAHGAVDRAWLDSQRIERDLPPTPLQHANPLQPRRELPNPQVAIPEGHQFVRRVNQGQGHYSIGWAFVPDAVFDFEQVFSMLNGADVIRAKAIFITERGVFSYNMDGGVLSVLELDEAPDSRVELISDQPLDAELVENQLLAMVMP
ncbi:GTP-binding protein [Marinimicrobium sp. ABcell2]|uniref:CobW family GTP-binding protein n=1 Tax=Marinimicrobium sp. ABcell2 TaxID=3069751 RepID=UPI0027B2077D|nr:GTP-binding protein [Marinimicrobium sp. ABcell2]MDQ2076212.1 GTP-binding protein [Marinimicrobium sp. ABcell2]